MKSEIRVLGIDTSLRSTGIGVVEMRGNKMVAVEYGVIKTPSKRLHSECLIRLNQGIADVVARTKPAVAAIEGIFFCKNVKTALILGEARGVVINACAMQGLKVYEYAPRKVKQAVVGYGAADKGQVQKMVTRLLGLDKEPQEDASDALAIAICHLHNRTGYSALEPEPI